MKKGHHHREASEAKGPSTVRAIKGCEMEPLPQRRHQTSLAVAGQRGETVPSKSGTVAPAAAVQAALFATTPPLNLTVKVDGSGGARAAAADVAPCGATTPDMLRPIAEQTGSRKAQARQ